MKDKYRVIYQPRGAALEYSPLALNLYQGCPNGCTYCYVPSVLHKEREQFHCEFELRPNILLKIEDDLIEMQRAGDKRPVMFCFTCDPYPGIDDENYATRVVLRKFTEFNHPFQVLTKGGMKATRDFDLYKPSDAFATTLTLLSDTDSLKWEPGAATPDDRIASLLAAKRKGIKTWVSFEPVIDPQQVYTLYEITKDYVDLFKIGKLNHQASDIDWRVFGMKMIEMCERDRKPYMIKDALAKCLYPDKGQALSMAKAELAKVYGGQQTKEEASV